MLSFLEVLRAFMNTVMYADREYSYISDIADKPAIEKNKIEPLQAVSLYDSLFTSISAFVTLATSRASPISTDLLLAVFSTVINSTLSTKGMSVSFDSSSRRVSSSSFRVDLF